MKKFIFLTFAFLGWAFYEVSGGDEFAPEADGLSAQLAQPAKAGATASRDDAARTAGSFSGTTKAGTSATGTSTVVATAGDARQQVAAISASHGKPARLQPTAESTVDTVAKLAGGGAQDAAAADGVVLSQASFADTKPVPHKPNKDELAALDPAVLAAFSATKRLAQNAGAKLDGTQTIADSGLVDGGLLAGQLRADTRKVAGNHVNMRNGPGTSYSVVERLSRGQAVEVLSDPGNGWLKLRVSDSGRIGWMAEFLVTASAD